MFNNNLNDERITIYLDEQSLLEMSTSQRKLARQLKRFKKFRSISHIFKSSSIIRYTPNKSVDIDYRFDTMQYDYSETFQQALCLVLGYNLDMFDEAFKDLLLQLEIILLFLSFSKKALKRQVFELYHQERYLIFSITTEAIGRTKYEDELYINFDYISDGRDFGNGLIRKIKNRSIKRTLKKLFNGDPTTYRQLYNLYKVADDEPVSVVYPIECEDNGYEYATCEYGFPDGLQEKIKEFNIEQDDMLTTLYYAVCEVSKKDKSAPKELLLIYNATIEDILFIKASSNTKQNKYNEKFDKSVVEYKLLSHINICDKKKY